MKRILLTSLSFIFVAAASPALAGGLAEAERTALERNLNLQSVAYAARAGEATVRGASGIYDPLASVELGIGEERERQNFQFFFGDTQDKYRTFDFGVSQLLPSGATIALDMANRRSESDPATFVNPSYASTLRFSVVQPLLEGFGSTPTEQAILYASRDRDIALEALRGQATSLLAEVRDAWYEVLRARDAWLYRQTSVELAEKVLSDNRARVEAGVLPPVENLEAEVGLLQRQQDLLLARRAYDDALDALALSVGSVDAVDVGEAPLAQVSLDAQEESGYQAALQLRPDYLQRLQRLQRLTLDEELAGNRLLPSLDLSGSYAHKGLGEEYSDDIDDVASDDLRSWGVGLTLSYPIGNRAARYDHIRARLSRQGEEATLGFAREQIRTEVRVAIRALEVGERQIDVTRRGTDLAAEKLRILLSRKDVGLATTRDVLEGEEDLARARTDHIAALAAYNRAATAYLTVTGQLLQNAGVRLTAAVDPEGSSALIVPEIP